MATDANECRHDLPENWRTGSSPRIFFQRDYGVAASHIIEWVEEDSSCNCARSYPLPELCSADGDLL
jgi:hypothetical protein